jgi:hypothetical protein
MEAQGWRIALSQLAPINDCLKIIFAIAVGSLTRVVIILELDAKTGPNIKMGERSSVAQ